MKSGRPHPPPRGFPPISIPEEIEEMEEIGEIEIIGAAGFQLFLFHRGEIEIIEKSAKDPPGISALFQFLRFAEGKLEELK